MPKDKFTPKQQEMLARAQQVINNASADYLTLLKEQIITLKKSINSELTVEAIHICHRIHSQAGTFGWPLITEVSGWFKRLLEIQLEKKTDKTVNDIFLSSLDLILDNDLRGEPIAAVALLQQIEENLKKAKT